MTRSPEAMRASVERNLLAKTGKPLEEWVALVRKQGLAHHGPIVRWLMTEHDLTRGYAGAIAWALRQDTVSPAELVERQYGGKEALLPVLAALRRAIPKGAREELRLTYVAWTNDRQFALLQPSAKSRADLGLVLPGEADTERLRAAGSFGSGRITHRVALTGPAEVDGEVRAWLETAFARAAS